jgi:4-diphosphocytidyl-2-C-methyl-D-erythritol kinase
MAGLGGSATDVATIIKWVTNKYRFKLLPSHIRYIALHIGSDIPFFLCNYPSAWVSAYGNKVKPNNKTIPSFKLILTKIPVNTTQVYSCMNHKYTSQVNVKHAYQALINKPFRKDIVYNDMWVFANKLDSRLSDISRKLSHKKNIILSGSGGSFVEIP